MDRGLREKQLADALEQVHRVRAALAETEEARGQALEFCRLPEVSEEDRIEMFKRLGDLEDGAASLRGALVKLERIVEGLWEAPRGEA